MGLQTKRFTTSAGIVLATMAGLVAWAAVCAVIYVAVAA